LARSASAIGIKPRRMKPASAIGIESILCAGNTASAQAAIGGKLGKICRLCGTRRAPCRPAGAGSLRPPYQASSVNWIDEQVFGGTAMKRLPALLMLLTVLAWAAPATAQLFAKKPKVNPSQRVPELILIVKTDTDDRKRARAAEELRDYDVDVFAEIVPVL